MSRPISWLPQLHAIRRSVSNSARSHYERRDLEHLFKLQTAAAGKLLDILPTVRLGSGLLVEREKLEKFLDRVAEADDVPALINQIRTERAPKSRRRLRRLTRYDQEPIGMTALPDWMKLARGRLEVDFTTVEQLAEGMFMIAGILLHELDAFTATYEPLPAFKEEDRKAVSDVRAMFQELEQMEAARA